MINKDKNVFKTNINQIFEKCSLKSSNNQTPSKSLLVSDQTYLDSWNAFIKWSKTQLDLDRTVIVPNFCSITYKKNDKDEQYIAVTLLEQYLFQNGLSYSHQKFDLKYPTVKINFGAVAKFTEIDKQIVLNSINNIFSEISDMLGITQDLEMDLEQLGKFQVSNRVITFVPLIKNLTSTPRKKQTVQNLVNLKAKNNSKVITRSQMNSSFYKNQNLKNSAVNEVDSSIEAVSPTKKIHRRVESLHISATKDMSEQFQSSPTRRTKKMESVHLLTEMLGAGTDPLARDQNFSKMVNDPGSLFSASFKRPNQAQLRFPPVIDKFSRTLARPICSQKFNHTESARIGSNYNLYARHLYVDLEKKTVKALKQSDNKVNFTANIEYLQTPATMEEELYFILTRDMRFQNKVKSKYLCYNRYQAFIQNEISNENVNQIREYWINNILQRIPQNFTLLTRQFIQDNIENMLQQITVIYYDSMKRSILNYCLKDKDECQRLGIMYIPRSEIQQLDYGLNYYKGLEPDLNWKQNINVARVAIAQYSVIYCDQVLKLMKIWKDYEKKDDSNFFRFLYIPKKKDNPLTISQFIQGNDTACQRVKQNLTQQWLSDCIAIYQNELEEQSNKTKIKLFFEANSTLMHNQIRQLILSQLEEYRHFFQRFYRKSYKSATQVVQEQCDPLSPIEDVFLEVKIQDQNNTIVFSESLDSIKQSLIQLIYNIVDVSNNFLRPDANLLIKSQSSFIWVLNQDDEVVVDILDEIESIINDNMQEIAKVLEIYNKYAFLLKEMEVVNNFTTLKDTTTKKFQEQIDKYKKIYNEVNEELPFFVRMNMIEINGIDTKKQYLNICSQIISNLIRKVQEDVQKIADEQMKYIHQIIDSITSTADTVEKLVEIEQNIERIRTKDHKIIKSSFEDVLKWMFFIFDNQFKIDEEISKIFNFNDQVQKLIGKVDIEELRIKDDREKLEEELRARKNKFIKDIDEIYAEIENLKYKYTSDYQKDEANQQIDQLMQSLTEMNLEMEDINMKEELIGWPVTEFPKLPEALANCRPYQSLWQLCRTLSNNKDSWQKEISIFKLNPEEIERETKLMLQGSIKLTYVFEKNKTCQKLAQEMVSQIQTFEQNLPIIKILSNPGLKERHWEEITEIVGYPIHPEKKKTLSQLMDIKSHKEKLEEISETASREFNIETILIKQVNDWEEICAEIKVWKDTGTYAVSGGSVEEIVQLLDDQTVKTSTMKGSPFARIFDQKINEWESWLNYSQSMMDYWIKVQNVWLYLEPIFASPDIVKHLPNEAVKFKEVDVNWRSMMGKINANPKVIEFTKNRKMLDTLKECHNSLEIVQKGLNEYLEGKRGSFPRFYFLSNDELLEILSETKDPERVQPHLKKCFEGIQKLKFDEQKRIHGMYSTEKEYVEFTTIIDTASANGQVDEWLVQVEQIMISSVHKATEIAFIDYKKIPRVDWVLNRCGMAVLCMSMTYWTYEFEKLVNEKGVKGTIEFSDQCNTMLQDLVTLVRMPINNLDRCTLEALIVLDVHNKDVIVDLAKKEIGRISEFDWQAQLRYYWIENNSIVRLINAELKYNYEYLGNSARLVITQLTDRCYRTLCGALYLNYGGAPEGPAGTGKTETVKDLAKALARQCVVFNCSDGLDFRAMGKFFKGLASSGAWACFDEFNRIDLEVLSVVAQQILCIQIARTAKKERFEFEGVMIRLIPTCNVFITMNPGYAGRSELPDNLKVLFRTVAMMVPDYALIGEISLYSFGFKDARNLARKIVTTYQLCSEQLSSQSHYDYGMRAVKSVLTAAGNLKRKFPEGDESILMLRSINDVNLAKFLAPDIPLFKGITSDLFPGVSLPVPDYKSLLECIANNFKKDNITSNEYHVEKIIQLYEMILVRHGLMVVGNPFSGKSMIIKTLKDSLSDLCELGLMGENTTQTISLNPKSISMNLLYGFADTATNEWTDGLLAVKFRQFAKDESNDRKWLIFDGPVDAIWIENMNTVLDDNKKLCLNSGEIIAMNGKMNMIFEPMDLLVASPATVSRCGMVYMEPEQIGWRPNYSSWLKTLPEYFQDNDIEEIDMLFQWTLDPTLRQLRDHWQEISPSQDQNLVQSLQKMLSSFFAQFEDKEQFQALDIKVRHNLLDQYFVFCLVWSIGGAVTTDYRKPFDLYLKRLFGGDIKFNEEVKTKKINIPDRGLLFDYKYQLKSNKSDGEWILWTDLIDKTETISAKLHPSQIIVKTQDTVRYSYFLNINIKNTIPTVFVGPTGTGKSVYIKNVLMNDLEEDFMTIEIGFSAQTTAAQTQEMIDSKIDRRRKGIFGPKNARAVLFIDDLNMPAKESWGAQPPIEILRQFIDTGGWYDNKDKEKPFKKIVDVQLVSAMGPPGGGRTFITPRMLRHLNMISLAQFDDESLNRIFSTILNWYFTNNKFTAEVVKTVNNIVNGTIDIYKASMVELLPTPMKSHYLFNLRDFSKVIIGLCMSNKETCSEPAQVTRLWTHEIMRVFGDRLINETDKNILFNLITTVIKTKFGQNFELIFEHLAVGGKVNLLEMRGLMWTDVLTPIGAPVRNYEEVRDLEKLQKAADDVLINYNMMTDKPMDLVLFSFAVEHLLIIARVLKQPGGNALLVGVGGQGRNSLTKLAAQANEQEIFQIEISKTYGKVEWQDDLRRLLKQAGAKLQPTTFLFSDTQIKQEGFVEDINNLLNTAEIPNLYTTEEKVEICEMVRPTFQQQGGQGDGTPVQLYAFFISQVKKNLHVVLCFSPIGDVFRNRVRNFPSLVNCCTIDWFQEWPSDALYSVAKRFLGDTDMVEENKEKCGEMMMHFHSSTETWASDFFQNLGRKYYVTPTSYLEMILTFRKILRERQVDVKGQKDKYQNGREKIIETEGKVDKMKDNLIQLKPKLVEAQKETEAKIIVVTKEKEIADVIKASAMKEEAIVNIAVQESNVIEKDCQKDLDAALPALKAAEDALKVLDPKEVTILKTFKQPPEAVMATMHACCLLVYPHPTEKKKNEKTMKNEVDWWEASKKLLNNPAFLGMLKEFDLENVDEKLIVSVGNFLHLEENVKMLTVENVRNSSTACACIIMWINGVYNFYWVNKTIKPKKAKLAEARHKVEGLKAKLAIEQNKLKAAVDKVDALQADLNQSVANKDRLEREYNTCNLQLERAEQLILNLGGEKGRWGQLAEKLSIDYDCLTGDVLISSGMIAYLGAFTASYRLQISKQWIELARGKSIPSSENYSLQNVLGDPVKIRSWNIDGLPSDGFSIENGIIVNNSRRWPLSIDPQNQANKWIKKMEGPHGLEIIKLSDQNYLRTLENSIQFGKPVLLENVQESLDPALNPILLKQTFKKGAQTFLKLGDQAIEYHESFNFYITTKLRNPHYLPELSTKVTLLNFMITYEGLTDQLLGILVEKERPELEKEKERLIIEGADNKKQLSEIEKQILEVLANASNILNDESGINVLTMSKIKSNEIAEKQVIAEATEKKIDEARLTYLKLSQEVSTLFFAITDLANIDPMYQYSLVYYIDLFKNSIIKSEPSEVFVERLANIRNHFLYSLYCNICRSLFEKDKLLFSFLLTSRIQAFEGKLKEEHLRFLLRGGISLDGKFPDHPAGADWLPLKAWQDLTMLAKLEQFEEFDQLFVENLSEWKKVYDSETPINANFPGAYTDFQKLLIIRCLRFDKMVPAVFDYVQNAIGKKFIEPPSFNLGLIYQDSYCHTPLIFVLSPGSDPFASLMLLADSKEKEVRQISLGQGQGPLAQKMIDIGMEDGSWVVLQNCHLAVTWMTTLDRICEQLDPKKIHPDFRLWLTSYPSAAFPQSILQNGVKMTNEPPKGLRANIIGSYLKDPIVKDEFFNGCEQSKYFKKMLYGLCFFHAVIQERRKYGPLGWNIPYEFNDSDLIICVRQLRIFLDGDTTKVDYPALKYLTGECNYGGRVTDDKDRRLIMILLEDYYNKDFVEVEGSKFTDNELYTYNDKLDTQTEFIEQFKEFPNIQHPNVYGFHANADITKDIGESNQLLDNLLLCAGTQKGGGGDMEDTLRNLVAQIKSDFPGAFDIRDCQEKYPVMYTESMNTVLCQELIRFNRLINIINSSLKDLEKAFKGLILMSQQLEEASIQLFNNKVPNLWIGKSYPSQKPLGAYINNLKERIGFLQKWIDEGKPNNYWISGFYFTHSFLTGVLQNFARKYTIPIDLVKFDYQTVKDVCKTHPEDGACVYGLFLEGAKWNMNRMQLDESDNKILFSVCPPIMLIPAYENFLDFPFYNCPIYKTSTRRGVLATTGHSSNFVMYMKLASDLVQNHWIKRGVALLTQLDD